MLHLELEKIHEYTQPVSKAGSLMAMDSFYKARQVLSEDSYENVAVSISGGRDSDIMLDLITKILKDNSEVRYIWFDTGLEYQATKRHLDDLERKYGITIERLKAQKPIPLSCKEYGIPFLSKMVSENIERLQKYGFQWEDEDYETLAARYPKIAKSSISWWCNLRDTGEFGYSMFNIDYNTSLKDFLIANPPTFNVSKKCCNYAKKNVSHKFIKDNNIDLMIMGIRKAEGGVRSMKYKTCWDNPDDGCHFYRPLFWYTTEDEKIYDETFGVTHSDCYEVWGFTRTGCVGCPFNRNVAEELEIVREREPQMYKACQHVFGQSYAYTAKYRRYQQAAKEGKLLNIGGKKHCLDDLLETEDD